MHKTDTDGDETKVLTQHYLRLGGSKGLLLVPLHLRAYLPSLEEFKTQEKQ